MCRVTFLRAERSCTPSTLDPKVGLGPGNPCPLGVAELRAAQAPRRVQKIPRRPRCLKTVGALARLRGGGGSRSTGCAPGPRCAPASAGPRAHLQVGEVPGAVVLLAARPSERGPEVHLDQLPVGAEADVAEDAGAGDDGRETALFGPRSQVPTVQTASPQASAPTCTMAQRDCSCPGGAALGLNCHLLHAASDPRLPGSGVAELGSRSRADSLPLPCTGPSGSQILTVQRAYKSFTGTNTQ